MTTENTLPTEGLEQQPTPPQDAPADQPPVDAAPPADDPAPAELEPEDGESGEEGESGIEAFAKSLKGRAGSRIRELIAERKALEEYATYWRNKALEQLQPATPKQQEPTEKPAPKLEDFDSTEKWAAAYAQWTEEKIARKAEEAAAQRLARAREEETRATLQSQWQERLSKFAEKHPDAHVVIANPTLPITQAMTEVITSSELGPEIAYHLGKNPAEAARIARMSPTQQAAALGRLEAKLASAPPPAAPRRPVSRAPEPPAPIDGSGTPTVDLENCSISEYLERRLGRRKRA